MTRWTAAVYPAVALACALLATLQPHRVPEADAEALTVREGVMLLAGDSSEERNENRGAAAG